MTFWGMVRDMNPVSILSAAEQVAAHLKKEIYFGRIHGQMPGIHKLAKEISTNHKTVKSALLILEKEGLIVPQGNGKCRNITLPKNHKVTSMRIAILLYEPNDRKIDFMVELQHRLSEAGYIVKIPSKTLTELGMNLDKVKTLVRKTDVDAWIVVAGSTAVLEWFSSQPMPVFALFGRMSHLPIAATGPKKSFASVEAVRRLVELGHRRIVLIAREERRKPEPGEFEKNFLNELNRLSVPTGDYNLPDWQETPAGFRRLLDSIFALTPPTAIMTEGAPFFFAVQQYVALRGLLVPRDISLISLDPDPSFAWCTPTISHIHYDSLPWMQGILRWANSIARGKINIIKTYSEAKFIEGGTIGLVRK